MNRISAVVCTKNSAETLETALKSLKSNTPDEIIIVDGNSIDKTLKISRRYTDKIYSDQGKGLALARQIGAEKAKGEYVAYIDADTELPDKNILNRMLRELLENKWVAIHARMRDPRKDKCYWEEGEDFHFNLRFNEPGEKKQLGTIVCLIKRSIILEYKFDPSFSGAAEDADLFHRLSTAGHKFGVSTLTAYHYHRSSFPNFYRQRIWYGKGNAQAIIKHKAINLFFTPLAIGLYGTGMSLYKLKPKFIPFYLIWMIILLSATIWGFILLIIPKN